MVFDIGAAAKFVRLTLSPFDGDLGGNVGAALEGGGIMSFKEEISRPILEFVCTHDTPCLASLGIVPLLSLRLLSRFTFTIFLIL